MTKPKYIQVF